MDTIEGTPHNSGFKDGWYTFVAVHRAKIGPYYYKRLAEMIASMPYAPIHKNLPGYWEGHLAGEYAAEDAWNELWIADHF